MLFSLMKVFFILRRGTTDLNLVFTGAVPTKPQVTTIPGNKLTMVASRYPVGTTVAQLGFHNLPGWQEGSASTGDRFFLWDGSNWLTYYRSGGFGSAQVRCQLLTMKWFLQIRYYLFSVLAVEMM